MHPGVLADAGALGASDPGSTRATGTWLGPVAERHSRCFPGLIAALADGAVRVAGLAAGPPPWMAVEPPPNRHRLSGACQPSTILPITIST
jgi:hypothetical protein